MKTDAQIQRDVERELRWCSGIDVTDICVSVSSGVVALSGFARNYHERSEAEEAAKRIIGVIAIANDIQVRLPACSGLTDPEIARASIEALKVSLPLTWQRIQPVVQERCVILEGTVGSDFERAQAESALRRVRGVRSLTSRIRVDNA